MNEINQPSRVKEIPPDQMTPEQETVLKDLVAGRGKILTPYKIWLHSPRVAAAMETLGTFLNKKGSLTEREVEFGIIIIAHHWHGEYVYQAHVKRCLELGVPQSVVDAIRNDKPAAIENPRDKAIYDILKAAEQPGPGSDEFFDGVVQVLGRDGVAEALCLLGYYSAVAMAMKLHRVPVSIAGK